MPLTKIDIGSYVARQGRDFFSSVCASNPAMEAGVLAAAGACSAREGIGSQVAVKLALESFLEGATKAFSSPSEIAAQDALEGAFRSSNASVFDFGVKLAAGGRMAASMVALMVSNGVISVGRVGKGAGYLIRDGELFPFFEDADPTKSNDPAVGNFIGAQALVTVELATVELQGGDNIVIFSDLLSSGGQESLMAIDKLEISPDKLCEEVISENIPTNNASPIQFGLAVKVGPETIYLGEEVKEIHYSNEIHSEKKRGGGKPFRFW